MLLFSTKKIIKIITKTPADAEASTVARGYGGQDGEAGESWKTRKINNH
jgi:hypothetical protein